MKYKIILSTKHTIPLDDDELSNVLEALKERKTVKVRQGIFNPSYVVSILPDTKRIDSYREHHKYAIREGRVSAEPPRLEDAFSNASRF
jgi:hypothetical protein